MYFYPKDYDVIVVGGGHAGIEAALACAKMGCETLMITMKVDAIGRMSCNPAIGGLAKSQLVREVDALGGEMALAADRCGIQFRTLNASKGPAVVATRAQCDKLAYQNHMRRVCECQERLDVFQDQVTAITTHCGCAKGVLVALGVRFRSKTVVVTTGTFLAGLMHIGNTKIPGGRYGEVAARGLSSSLESIGLEIGRLKTGTPPRLKGSTVNFAATDTQHGEEPPPYFTFRKDELFHMEHGVAEEKKGVMTSCKYPPNSVLAVIGKQLPCQITYTTEQTAEVVRRNLHRSPLYGGTIRGIGPRYCPSIEDKIVRFADKPRHQIFLEPEGADTAEVYVNGFSTSLPFDIQIELVKTIVGCENAAIIRPAYAVEYDFVYPTQLRKNLETKVCENLFLAGQINGTSGYEEAAAQGIVAGINAAARVLGRPELIIGRDKAYIGVMIDDLVTKGTVEPYRMFTSRAEFRLLLRQDNADLRLSSIGHELGILPGRCFRKVECKRAAIRMEIERLNSTRWNSTTLAHLLKRPEVSYADLPSKNDGLDPEVVNQVEIEIKYSGYIQRQRSEVEKLIGMETKVIPASFDYTSVPNLRSEARQKLASIRPATLGEASRISGVSPADVSILSVFLKRGAESARKLESSPSIIKEGHSR